MSFIMQSAPAGGRVTLTQRHRQSSLEDDSLGIGTAAVKRQPQRYTLVYASAAGLLLLVVYLAASAADGNDPLQVVMLQCIY